MMDALTSTTATPNTNVPTESVEEASKISSDFETFLTMLTAQITNQDPLNPVDSTDFATQLATFSSVEQQVLTNDLLKNMTNLLNGSTLQQMGEWLGKEVLVKSSVRFEGEPLEIHPEFAHGADTAYLVVRNEAGTLVDRQLIPVQEGSLAWDGLDDGGAAYSNGNYSFAIENYAQDVALDTTTPAIYTDIVEVRTGDGNFELQIQGGMTISPDEVLGLRNIVE